MCRAKYQKDPKGETKHMELECPWSRERVINGRFGLGGFSMDASICHFVC